MDDPNHGFFFHFCNVALKGELPKEYLPVPIPQKMSKDNIYRETLG